MQQRRYLAGSQHRAAYCDETYRVDFVVNGKDDRTFMVDVAESLPRPPGWIGLPSAYWVTPTARLQ